MKALSNPYELQSCVSTDAALTTASPPGELGICALNVVHSVPAGMLQPLINVLVDQQGRLPSFPLQGNAWDSGDPTKPPEGDVRTVEISLYCCWESV